MKTIFTIGFVFISSLALNAQDKKSNENKNNEINNWTVEAYVGHGKGVNPYSIGYYSSNPNTLLGGIQINDFSLGFRYMINEKFGVKSSLSYQNFKNIKNNGSLPFEMKLMGINFQGVVNLRKVFDLEESFKKVGLFVHGGIKIDQMESKTKNNASSLVDHNYGLKEYNGGFILGLTPQFKLSDKLSLNFDVTIQSNYRQHFNWDGSNGISNNNLKGQIISSSLGLTYSIGKFKNGDWSESNFKKNDLIKMKDRLAEIETLMNDSDKDGVPDYLDAQNNSITGVAVNTKGIMIDLNNNNIPDELENHLSANYFSKSEQKDNSNTDDIIKKLINEGYVCSYFEFNKIQPSNESSEGIDFILTFLRNYKNSTIDIIGHADEVGNTDKNQKLANSRALNVKETLIKAGISSDRLNIISEGEDTSVDITSENARRLVRRVTFKIK